MDSSGGHMGYLRWFSLLSAVLLVVLCGWAWGGDAVFTAKVPNVEQMLKGGGKPAEAVRAMLNAGLENWSKVKTMEATFTRRELLEGKTERGDNEVIHLRERVEPKAIYMRWQEGPGKGREISYMPSRSVDRFVVTPGGRFRWLILERPLEHPDVFAVSRHSPAQAGMGALLAQLDDQFRKSEADAVVTYAGVTEVAGRPAHRFMRFLPEKDGPDGKKYYSWKLDLCLDKETGLPLAVKCYGWQRQHEWQKEPFEEYYYSDMVFNGEMEDKAFNVGRED